MVDLYLSRGIVFTMAAHRLDDGSDCYAAWPDDFPGCIGEGRTPDEAVERLEAILPSYLNDVATEGRLTLNELPKIIPGIIQFYDEVTGELPKAGEQTLASFPKESNPLLTVAT